MRNRVPPALEKSCLEAGYTPVRAAQVDYYFNLQGTLVPITVKEPVFEHLLGKGKTLVIDKNGTSYSIKVDEAFFIVTTPYPEDYPLSNDSEQD